MLCNNPQLRLSVWNNDEYLYVQAVLWQDDADAMRTLANGSQIGDQSSLCLDIAAAGRRTANLDRDYWLYSSGPWYQVVLGVNSWTTLKPESKGRGAIRYVDTTDRRRVRVDSYLIPLRRDWKAAASGIAACLLGGGE